MNNKKNILNLPEVKNEVQKAIFEYLNLVKHQTIKRYKMLNKHIIQNQILFVGSSSIEFFPISEFQLKLNLKNKIYNRGVNTETSIELLENIDTQIIDLKPSKIFLSIGQNDIGNIDGFEKKSFIDTYAKILTKIKKELPDTQVFILGFFPINPDDNFGLPSYTHDIMFRNRSNSLLNEINDEIQCLSQRFNYNFLNLNSGLFNEKNNLKTEFSMEGLHMWPTGYYQIMDELTYYLKC